MNVVTGGVLVISVTIAILQLVAVMTGLVWLALTLFARSTPRLTRNRQRHSLPRMTVLMLLLSACGYSSKQSEMIAQVKKVIEKTPVLCADFVEADVSLGVVRNGTGSLSKEDVSLYVPGPSDVAVLKKAGEHGLLVKITYDVVRLGGICVPDHWVTHAEIISEDGSPSPEFRPGSFGRGSGSG